MDSEDDGSRCCCSCASSSSSLKSALLLFLDNTGVTGLSFNKFVSFSPRPMLLLVLFLPTRGPSSFSLFVLISLNLSLSLNLSGKVLLRVVYLTKRREKSVSAFVHKTDRNYTCETQCDEGKRTECSAIYLGRILLCENYYSEIAVYVRNADGKACDGFSALLFVHKNFGEIL